MAGPTSMRRRSRKYSHDLTSSSSHFPPIHAPSEHPLSTSGTPNLSGSSHWSNLNGHYQRRAFSSLPKLFTGMKSRESTRIEEHVKEVKRLPPLKRTNTVTRFLIFARLAKSFATNIESRRQAIPPKEKLSKDFWKKARNGVKRDKKTVLSKKVYRIGTTWKLKATAFVGEPSRIDVIDKALSNVLNIAAEPENEEDDSSQKALERFRHAVRIVLYLLSATTTSRQAGERMEAQFLDTFAHYQEDEDATRALFYADGLTFNADNFKANRQVQLSEESKAVLQKYPAQRTEEELKLVLVNLQQAVKAFSEYPNNIKQALVRVGWYEHYTKKRVIIRQGHLAACFYFIISGNAVVSKISVNDKTSESFIQTVAFLGKGNSFGELGLMYGSYRSATVSCKGSLELLTVGREDFVDIFMHVETDKVPDHILFLRSLDILNGWPVEKIPLDNPKICLFTYFRRGTVMCKDTSETEWIYFFKTGSCRVLMALTSTKPQLQSKPSSMPVPRDLMIDTPKFTDRTKQDRLYKALHGHYESQATTGNGKWATWEEEEEEETESDPHPVNEHKDLVFRLFDEKHPQHTRENREFKLGGHGPPLERALPPVEEEAPAKQKAVFVQIQVLGPKDSFGITDAALPASRERAMPMSLVSDGCEAVLISKRFFLQHLTDQMKGRLRATVQPYPTVESLQQKLQNQTNWEAYKQKTIRQQRDHHHSVKTLHVSTYRSKP